MAFFMLIGNFQWNPCKSDKIPAGFLAAGFPKTSLRLRNRF